MHDHKGRHLHHFTINIVTYRSTRVATHKPKKINAVSFNVMTYKTFVLRASPAIGTRQQRSARGWLHLPRTSLAHRSHSGGGCPDGSENAASAVTLHLAPFQAQLYGGWEILRISKCTLEKESSRCTHMAEMTYCYDSQMQSNQFTHYT